MFSTISNSYSSSIDTGVKMSSGRRIGKIVLMGTLIVIFLSYSFNIAASVYWLISTIGALVGKIIGILVLPFPQTKNIHNPLL